MYSSSLEHSYVLFKYNFLIAIIMPDVYLFTQSVSQKQNHTFPCYIVRTLNFCSIIKTTLYLTLKPDAQNVFKARFQNFKPKLEIRYKF